MITKTYTELSRFETFDARFDYLNLQGVVGETTFGYERWLNQGFYRSRAWRNVREQVIIRDNGCDLGVEGYEIHREILIHHINPMSPRDIEDAEEWILDPEFLITTTKTTHNAIHYGTREFLPRPPVDRTPGDTLLWSKGRMS